MSAKSRHPLESTYGPLELRVLESLWARATPACVRDLQPQFPGVAYTTLMTTLDRLYRKGALGRDKHGRAFFYSPAATRDQMVSTLAGSALASLLPGNTSSARPILSMFVDTVGARDRTWLDELEKLVRARRDELKAKGPR